MLTAIHLGRPCRRGGGGRSRERRGGQLAAWWPGMAAGGRALPYAAHSGLEAEDPAALIPVERVAWPIPREAAGADRVWPSADMARACCPRDCEHGDPYGHTVLEYPCAGHSLGHLIPRLGPGLLPPDLVDEPVDQAARADAWPKVVDFICRAGGI